MCMLESDTALDVLQIVPPVYDLYAVANHMGNPAGGHYTAHCKTGDGSWHCFDDDEVNPSNLKHVVSSAAYSLFYKRRQQVPTSN